MENLKILLQYYLSEHPSIVNFRWSLATPGSTWSFLFCSLAVYVSSALLLNLCLSWRRRPLPLGPLPAIHNLTIAVACATIFAGLSLSAVAEIRDTRWFWHRSKTPIQWLLCFPIGTRPSGRVFFWSYLFYATRYLLLPQTLFSILQRRPFTPFRLFFHHSTLIFMSFLWLEFSQSFQVVSILATSSIYSVMYGYRFWTSIQPAAKTCFPVVVNCQFLLLGCYVAAHIGVLLLHFREEGCNGIGAWFFNSVLNGALLLLFLNFHVRKQMHLKRSRVADEIQKNSGGGGGGGGGGCIKNCRFTEEMMMQQEEGR